jgi:hypothetical protein
LLGDVLAVLDEYRVHLPLTCRQIFYRLVGAHGYDKTEAAYERLCEHLGRARRAGIIPFASIRDDGGARHEAAAYAGSAAFIAAVGHAARAFRMDRQTGQPVRLWLLCEAAGMAPMLAEVARQYGVPVLSSGGFDSLTARAEVLHIGDHDPSGVHLFSSLAEDVAAMVDYLGGEFEPVFTRLAVTPAQIAELDLPTAPPKATDRRAFSGETVQAEAIPPDVLARIVREAIEARQDVEARTRLVADETEARARLLAWLGVE